MKDICYQNVDSEKFSLKNPLGVNSKFWNEGRCRNFIEPFLPEDCTERTFLEVGCNAGMFLKMAVDKGFGRVVGLERSKKYTARARYYKKKIGYDYKIINKRLGSWDCDYMDMPMADVVLMSCVHYHMRPVELVKSLDHLIVTSMYCIVVSVTDRPIRGNSVNRVSSSEDEIMRYYKDWERIRTITVDTLNDPSPRNMFSILFKSRLKRYKVHDLLNPKCYNKKLRNPDYCIFFTDFAKKVISNNSDLRKTEFYKIYIQGRKTSLSNIREKRLRKLKLMIKDVYKNGMKEPLLVGKNGLLVDGSHRLILLDHLGYEYVIGREV